MKLVLKCMAPLEGDCHVFVEEREYNQWSRQEEGDS